MKLLTKDLFEAAFLKSRGMRLMQVHGNAHSVVMEFDGDESLEVLKNQYESRRAEVNVHALKKQLAEVKDLLFAAVRSAKASGTPLGYSRDLFFTNTVK